MQERVVVESGKGADRGVVWGGSEDWSEGLE